MSIRIVDVCPALSADDYCKNEIMEEGRMRDPVMLGDVIHVVGWCGVRICGEDSGGRISAMKYNLTCLTNFDRLV